MSGRSGPVAVLSSPALTASAQHATGHAHAANRGETQARAKAEEDNRPATQISELEGRIQELAYL
jgi:hypothetical protein